MTFRAALVLILALLFAGSSFLSDFGGYDSTQLPVPLEDPPMQPAGWAFAIWGPIYLWLIASAAFGLVLRRRAPHWDATRWPLALSLLIGVPWLSVAEAGTPAAPLWATVMIVGMWAGAVAALMRSPPRDRPWLREAIGLYAGWLTAATAVSFGLVGAGWGVAMGPEGWAVAAILVAVVVGASVLTRVRSWAFAAALAWALVGVAVRNDLSGPPAWVALGAALLVGALALAGPRAARGTA